MAIKKGLKIGLIVGGVIVLGVAGFLVIRSIKKKKANISTTPEIDDMEKEIGNNDTAEKPPYNDLAAKDFVDKNSNYDVSKKSVILEQMKKTYSNENMYNALKQEADEKGISIYQKLYYYSEWLLKNKGLI